MEELFLLVVYHHHEEASFSFLPNNVYDADVSESGESKLEKKEVAGNSEVGSILCLVVWERAFLGLIPFQQRDPKFLKSPEKGRIKCMPRPEDRMAPLSFFH